MVHVDFKNHATDFALGRTFTVQRPPQSLRKRDVEESHAIPDKKVNRTTKRLNTFERMALQQHELIKPTELVENTLNIGEGTFVLLTNSN